MFHLHDIKRVTCTYCSLGFYAQNQLFHRGNSVLTELCCAATFVPLALCQVYVCLPLFTVSDVLDRSPVGVPVASAGQSEQLERETGSLEKAQLLEIWCQALQLMPDTQRVSHFVRSLAELRARVFTYIWFQALQLNSTWPESPHVCLWICALHVCQGVTGNRRIRRVIRRLKTQRRGKAGDGTGGGHRDELGREFGVPVTWLECRSSHLW